MSIPDIIRTTEAADRTAAARGTRNLAAEVRWIEEGHQVHADPAAGVFWTVSERTGQRYEMTATAQVMGDGTAPIAFGCTCPSGARPVAIGSTGCKHRAGLARRLMRDGLAGMVEGRWVATPKALDVVNAPTCIACGSSDDDVARRPVDTRGEAVLCARCADSDEVLRALADEA